MSNPVEKKRRATYQDVLDAPRHMVAEIVAGELHLFPRPAGLATTVASTLGGELYMAFGRGRGPGGWIILDEPELHVAEDIVVPDLAGWRQERMSVVPEAAFFRIVPDWICEVLSPSTEKFDRAEKMALYASIGVGHAWLVNPRQRTLEVFRQHDGKWLTIAVHKDDDRARIEPFDIELEIAHLWAHLPLPTRVSEANAEYELAW